MTVGLLVLMGMVFLNRWFTAKQIQELRLHIDRKFRELAAPSDTEVEYMMPLIPFCFLSKDGPCQQHTFYIRHLPAWAAKMFVRWFMASSCVRTGGS